MINIFGDQGNGAKIFWDQTREHELKTFLGTRGFINGEQGIKSKNIKGSWEHVPPPPPWEGLINQSQSTCSGYANQLMPCVEKLGTVSTFREDNITSLEDRLWSDRTNNKKYFLYFLITTKESASQLRILFFQLRAYPP